MFPEYFCTADEKCGDLPTILAVGSEGNLGEKVTDKQTFLTNTEINRK